MSFITLKNNDNYVFNIHNFIKLVINKLLFTKGIEVLKIF